jgi:hypothetical protein
MTRRSITVKERARQAAFRAWQSEFHAKMTLAEFDLLHPGGPIPKAKKRVWLARARKMGEG